MQNVVCLAVDFGDRLPTGARHTEQQGLYITAPDERQRWL